MDKTVNPQKCPDCPLYAQGVALPTVSAGNISTTHFPHAQGVAKSPPHFEGGFFSFSPRAGSRRLVTLRKHLLKDFCPRAQGRHPSLPPRPQEALQGPEVTKDDI